MKPEELVGRYLYEDMDHGNVVVWRIIEVVAATKGCVKYRTLMSFVGDAVVESFRYFGIFRKRIKLRASEELFNTKEELLKAYPDNPSVIRLLTER